MNGGFYYKFSQWNLCERNEYVLHYCTLKILNNYSREKKISFSYMNSGFYYKFNEYDLCKKSVLHYCTLKIMNNYSREIEIYIGTCRRCEGN